MKNYLNDKAYNPLSSHFVPKKGKWLKGQLYKLTTTNNNSPLPNLGGEKCFTSVSACRCTPNVLFI